MAATAGHSRRRALLVATGVYADPGLAALRAPTGDVDALAAVLADGSIGEFAVSRLVDRPTEELKMEIEAFFGNALRDDLLLLYFSCHGVLSQSRRFYFATASTALNLLRATAIEDSFVNDVVQHSRARSVVLILDCCHSGAFGKGLAPKSALTVDVEHRFEGRGRVTLSASTALEYAFEEADPATGINALEPAAPGSLFTRCLVDGLATGDADMDRDGRISVDELYDYVCQRMREDVTHQTPGMAGDVRGEIVIARSPRREGLPTELHQAAGSRLAGVREGAAAELAELLAATDPRVAGAARSALERLARDDSGRVAARAREALGLPPPEAPVVPRPEPAPRRPRARSRPLMIGGVAAVVATAAAVWIFSGNDSGPPIPYDFDGDGAQEIVMSGPGLDAVLIADEGGVEPISTGVSGTAGTVTSGDFDGDGHSDLAVGFATSETVSIVYGDDDGPSRDRRQNLLARDLDLPGTATRYGANVLARDFDADGYTDLAVGAPGDPQAWQSGAVQIVFGSEQGLRTDRTRLLEQPADEVIAAFGSRLRSGDIDGDGHIDLVEGSPDPAEGDTAGHIAWCRGSADGPTACTSLAQVDGDSGSSALAVADVTGDGREDIVQGDTELPGGSGGLRLWRGGQGGPPERPVVITPDQLALETGALDDRFGAAVDAGPLDDDDFAEIVVGIPGHDGESGAVAVVRGAESGFAPTGHTLRTGDEPGARFGSTVAMLRLDGPEARPDVVIAAEGASALAQSVHVLRGDDLSPLDALAGMEGSPDSLRLGRIPGP